MRQTSRLLLVLAAALIAGCMPAEGDDDAGVPGDHEQEAFDAGGNNTGRSDAGAADGGQHDAGSDGGIDDAGVEEVVCEGQFLIENSLDVDAINDRGCTSIIGDITISSRSGISTFVLPTLRALDGELKVTVALLERLEMPSLETATRIELRGTFNSLEFPELRSATDIVFNEGTFPSTVEFPSLVDVGGDLTVFGLSRTTTLGLPALEAVGGKFLVRQTVVVALELPRLAVVGGLINIIENEALTSVRLDSLATAGSVSFAQNRTATFDVGVLVEVGGTFGIGDSPGLTSVNAPALSRVGSQFFVGNNPDITSLSFPVLVDIGVGGIDSPGLFLTNNATLASLSFPDLTTIEGSFTVTDNPGLPQCVVDELALRAGATCLCSGNSASCP